jgi:hypothetical protein
LSTFKALGGWFFKAVAGFTREYASPIFVGLVWTAMVFAVVLFISRCGTNLPFYDEFEMVPVMTGHRPISLQWLWSQHREHRLFLPRLVLLGLYRLSNNDFRAGIYFNAALLASASAMLILLVRRLRGHICCTDAVFPIALLHVGQWENLTNGFTINLVLPAWITYAAIGTTALATERPMIQSILRFSLYLLVLPLCGGVGAALLPPLALWFCCLTFCGWWSGAKLSKRQISVGLAMFLACSAVVGLYLYRYQMAPLSDQSRSVGNMAAFTIQYLGLALCADGHQLWSFAGLAVVLLVAVTIVRLVAAWWHSPAERPRAAGLLLTIASLLTLALAVGWGRTGTGLGFGLQNRYVTIAAPLLGLVYVAWVVYGPCRAGRTIQFCLFILTCVMIPSNVDQGLRNGESRRAWLKPVERALKRYVRGNELVARFGDRLYINNQRLYVLLCELKRGRVGAFRRFRDDRIATQGCVAGTVVESGSLLLSGWVAGLDIGVVDRFKVICGGKVFTEFEIAKGLPSPDVEALFPELDRVGTCGFHIRIPLAESEKAEVRGSTVICTPLFGGREGCDLVGVLTPASPISVAVDRPLPPEPPRVAVHETAARK